MEGRKRMKIIVIDDYKSNLFFLKRNISKLDGVTFKCIDKDGNIVDDYDKSDDCNYIYFKFDNLKTFVNNFINKIASEDILLVDLALTAKERDNFKKEKITVFEKVIEYAPALIKAIKEKNSDVNIIVISTHPNLNAKKDYQKFLTSIKGNDWFKTIGYIECAKVKEAWNDPKCAEELMGNKQKNSN
jgi:hypothetical protein